MSTSMTKRSTPRLSELARHVVAPKGVVSTGWPAVEKKCLELGVQFRPWQPDVGRLILAKRADGKYAATVGGTGLSIPRQVGKTFLVGAIVFALCLLRPNLTVIWTAHRLRTAEETFGKMQAFAKRKRIAPHILKLVLGSGDEAVMFRNGSRILFGARERGFGRGFDEVDVLIFDEAQILSESALDDMIPATNQSRQETSALLLFMGTPPKPTDPGEVFTRMRTEALTGEDDDTGWVEFGADPGYEPTPAPAPLTEADWRQVAKANPSYPQDTPREAILRMRKKLGPESFVREGLGKWDAERTADAVIERAMWSGWAHYQKDLPLAAVSFGVTVSGDRRRTFIGVAGRREDGRVQVELVAHGRGVAWAVEWLASRAQRWSPVAVVLDGTAESLEIPLAERGVVAVTTTSRERAQATVSFYDALEADRVRHPGEPLLDASVEQASKREMVAGWVWEGPAVGPLAAVTLAHHGLTVAPERRADPPPRVERVTDGAASETSDLMRVGF